MIFSITNARFKANAKKVDLTKQLGFSLYDKERYFNIKNTLFIKKRKVYKKNLN